MDRLHHITPKDRSEIQDALGADIMMAFDHCVALPSSREKVELTLARTNRWAARCQAARRFFALLGIVQGGPAELRKQGRRPESSQSGGLTGYAIAFSSGKKLVDVSHVRRHGAHYPHYLMGVGMPEDLVEGVA